jgi:hypothetical protein
MYGIVGIYMPDFKFWDRETAPLCESSGLPGDSTACNQGDAPAGGSAGDR